METKLTTIEEKLADRDTEYTHLMTLHENCEKKMIENENLQHKYTEMEIQLVQLQTTYNDTQDELKQAEEEFKTNLHQMKQEMIAAIREAKEMKQKAQNQLIQVRSTLENEIQGQKRIVETHVLKITQQEDHINQLRQKMFEETQIVSRQQRENSEKELSLLHKLQQSESKLESHEQRFVDCQRKLSLELQQRSADKLALLEMKTLHQNLARLEAQNQSLRDCFNKGYTSNGLIYEKLLL